MPNGQPGLLHDNMPASKRAHKRKTGGGRENNSISPEHRAGSNSEPSDGARGHKLSRKGIVQEVVAALRNETVALREEMHARHDDCSFCELCRSQRTPALTLAARVTLCRV